MTKEYTEHDCENRERQIIYIMGSWNMSDNSDGFIDIYYCPFCGVKLE